MFSLLSVTFTYRSSCHVRQRSYCCTSYVSEPFVEYQSRNFQLTRYCFLYVLALGRCGISRTRIQENFTKRALDYEYYFRYTENSLTGWQPFRRIRDRVYEVQFSSSNVAPVSQPMLVARLFH